MNNKKTGLFVLCAVLIVLLGGGSYLYQKFSGQFSSSTFPAADAAQNPDSAPADNQDNTPPSGSADAPGRDTESASSPSTEEGDEAEKQPIPAPDFTVYSADGSEVSLSGYEGKYVVLNFWASWCGPCKSEMPAFNSVIEQYKDDENIVFLMINMTDGQRETKESAQELIDEKGWEMDILFDSGYSAALAYNVYSLPTTVLVDKEGYLLAMQAGAISQETLEGVVKILLADQWERPLV